MGHPVRMRNTVVAVVMLPFLLGACEGIDDITGDGDGDGDVQGTYTLVDVDDQPLPFVQRDDSAAKEEITGGTITLGEGTSCSAEIQDRITDKASGNVQTSSETLSCSYTADGTTGTIIFEAAADAESATIDGDTIIVIDDEATVFRFEK